jgi:hypothetical protein
MVVKDIRKESVTIEWKPPADDGGLELSKYSVEKCDVEKMVWMKVSRHFHMYLLFDLAVYPIAIVIVIAVIICSDYF